MASTVGKSPKMRRSESRKSHSWWFDSHVGPKNKWLQGNLDDMDQNVKRMLKLIEEDAESFTKRAEMYYQKRPELIKLVEEFYRMYRSLAERYDLATGELRKSMPSDLRSQGSGISEGSSELPYSDQRPIERRRSGARAAGFEFFLGTGGTSSELGSREGDESSTLDSESESDNSSIISDDQILHRKIIELEIELRDVKNKLRMQQDEELIVVSEIDVTGNNPEVDKEPVIALSMEVKFMELEETLKNTKDELTKSEKEVESLRKELKISSTSKQLLQDQVGIAKKEASSCKAKLAREEREVSKLQDRITRYKSSLADRDQEIRRFKEAITNANRTLSEENSQLQEEITKLQNERSYLEDNLRELDVRCQSLEEEVKRVLAGKLEMEASLNEKVSEGNNLVTELTQSLDAITRDRDILLEEKSKLKGEVEELLAETSSKDDRIVVVKQDLDKLNIEHVELMAETEGVHKLVEELKSRIKELEETIKEVAEEKREVIRQLCFSIEHYRDEYQHLREALIGHRRYPVMAA